MPQELKDSTAGALTLSLSKEALEGVVSEAVTRGIAAGVESWKVTNAITAAAEEALLTADLPALVAASLKHHMQKGAAEMADGVAAGIVGALNVAATEIAIDLGGKMLAGILRKDYYGEDGRSLQSSKDKVRKMLAGGDDDGK